MLEGTDHQVTTTRRTGRADYPEGVGLGTAARENHLFGLGADEGGHFLPGLREGAGGGGTSPVAGRRISVAIAHGAHHGFDHLGGGRGRCRIIEVDGHGEDLGSA